MYLRYMDDRRGTWSGRRRIALPRRSVDVDGEQMREWNTGFSHIDAPRVLLSHVHVDAGLPHPRRRAEYPQMLQWGERFFAVYSSKKVDIMLKEFPAELLGA